MMRLLPIIILMIPNLFKAQNDCKKYDTYYQQAIDSLSQENYAGAIKYLKVARIEAEECNDTERYKKAQKELDRANIAYIQQVELQKRQADTATRATRLTALALEVRDKNPTLAMQLADYAYRYSDKKNDIAPRVRWNIYQDDKIGLKCKTFFGHRH